MRFLGLVLVIFVSLLLKETVSYETCIAVPSSVDKGGSCGGIINCKPGLYCNSENICATSIPVGSICRESSECEYGSDCRGYEGQQLCVAFASAGERCSYTTTNSTVPGCGSGLFCSGTLCANGKTGDRCFTNSDCSNYLFCGLNGRCTRLTIDGQPCFNSIQCSQKSFCNVALANPICQPRLTSGNCSDVSDACARGYECVKSKYTVDPLDIPQCVAQKSRKAGEYCGGSDTLCSSYRCFNNFCAKDPVDYCGSSNQCQANQFCGCGGFTFAGGVGRCTSDPCAELGQSLSNCAYENDCEYLPYNSNYEGACLQLSCQSLLTQYLTCSPSAQLKASILTLILAFVAFYILRK